MEEIKINEYVRDRDGIIIKVNNIVPDEDSDDIWYEEDILKGTWKSMIVKHSFDSRDLLEIGDFIELVINGSTEATEIFNIVSSEQIQLLKQMNTKYLKSILTKEQFEREKYKIGE